MNAIAQFRLCKLTDEELCKKVDEQTDNMFRSQKVPTRCVPARPDEYYDLLVGELIIRLRERRETTKVYRGNFESEKYYKEGDVFTLENGMACQV